MNYKKPFNLPDPTTDKAVDDLVQQLNDNYLIEVNSAADLPPEGKPGQLVHIRGSASFYIWEDPLGQWVQVGSVGVNTFVALTDTPASYTGEGLKGIRVNVGETALEFYETTGTDEKVKIDSAANADYLGAAFDDGVLRTSAPLTYTDGGNYITIGISLADTSTDGYLSSADWNTFNSKSDTDEKVKIDAGATAGYIGAASNDGVLRVGSPISYTDGGNFVTLDIAADGIKDTHIDWGTGANQVSAVDMPIADDAGNFTATDIENTLAELFDMIGADYGGKVWINPVLDKDLSSPPGGESQGDRYLVSDGASGDWYSAGGTWKYRQKVTIDNTKVPSNLSNFAVAVIIDESTNKVFGHARNDGFDILFTANDKLTKLDHEIEHYDDTTGNKLMVCWVRIPTLSSSADTDIYMYYGNASVGSDPSVVTTWDSSYKMVQHLDDLTTSTTDDSTTNNNDGTKIAANNPAETTGQIAKAQSFDGSDDIRMSYNASLNLASTITFECWIKANNPGGSWQTIIAHSPTAGQYNYWFYLQGNDLKLSSYSSGYPTITANNVINDTNWHHVAFIATSGGTTKIYVDKVEVASGAAGSSFWTGQYVVISDLRPSRNIRFSGIIDEARLSDSIRSLDWLTTCYNNQSSPSTFLTFASEEAPSAGGAWATHEKQPAEANKDNPVVEADWDFTTLEDALTCKVIDEDKYYSYNFSLGIWEPLIGAQSHDALSNLLPDDGFPSDKWHLRESEHAAATRLATDALSGLMPPGKMNWWDTAWHVGELITECIEIAMDKPCLKLHDTDDSSAYKFVHDAGDASYPNLALYRGTMSAGAFTPSPSSPLLWWDASNQLNIFTSGDIDDYIQFKTTSHVPEITTIGGCDLKINPMGNIDASTNLIKNVVDPVDNQDAATKKYVDDQILTKDTFLELTDTPANYTGDSLKGVRVNVGETALEFYTITDSDEKVKIDAAATAGYIGAAAGDGVLRTSSPLTYTDGGNFITIALDETAIDHNVLNNLAVGDVHTQYVLRQPAADTVINESGGDYNWRMEGVGEPNFLFFDSGNNYVGIKTATPTSQLHIYESTTDLWVNLFATTGMDAGLRLTERADGGYGVALYHDGGSNFFNIKVIDADGSLGSYLVAINRIDHSIGLAGSATPASSVEVGGSKNAMAGVGSLSNYTLGLRNSADANDIAASIAFTTLSYTDTNITAAIIAKRTGNYGKGELQFYTKQSVVDSANPVLGITLTDAGAVTIPGVVTMGDTSALATSAAPVADAQIANKKYVDDTVGAWDLDDAYTAGRTIVMDLDAIIFDVNDATNGIFKFDIDIGSGLGTVSPDDKFKYQENWILVNSDIYTSITTDADIYFDWSGLGFGETGVAVMTWLDLDITDGGLILGPTAIISFTLFDVDINPSVLATVDGDFIDFKLRGVQKFGVDTDGIVNIAGATTVGGIINANLGIEASGLIDANLGMTVDGGAVTINASNADHDTKIGSTGTDDMFVVDSGNDRVGINTATPQGTLDINGDIIFSKANIALSIQITEALAIGTNSIVRLTNTYGHNVYLDGITGGTDGRILIIYYSNTTYNISFRNNAASTAANGILTMSGGHEVSIKDCCIKLYYDGDASRWIMIGGIHIAE